jgi:hypothetical protein
VKANQVNPRENLFGRPGVHELSSRIPPLSSRQTQADGALWRKNKFFFFTDFFLVHLFFPFLSCLCFLPGQLNLRFT